MARWKLLQPHYLSVPGTEWEYKEMSRTGVPKRHRFPVPMYLDPEDGRHPITGRPRGDTPLIVCHEGKGLEGDITFIGEPSPDMEPMDEEAKKITQGLEKKWAATFESLGGVYGAVKLDGLVKELAAIQSTMQPTSPVSVVGSSEEIQALRSTVDKLIEQNTVLIQSLTKPAPALAESPRRL